MSACRKLTWRELLQPMKEYDVHLTEMRKSPYLLHGWLFGTIDGLSFQAKVSDERSSFGIGNGRVIKLSVTDDTGSEVISYERGWETCPGTPEDEDLLDALVAFLDHIPRLNEWYKLFQ